MDSVKCTYKCAQNAARRPNKTHHSKNEWSGVRAFVCVGFVLNINRKKVYITTHNVICKYRSGSLAVFCCCRTSDMTMENVERYMCKCILSVQLCSNENVYCWCVFVIL